MRLLALAALAASIPLVSCSDAATPLAPAGSTVSLSTAAALPATDGDIALPGIQLREGVFVNLSAHVYVNEAAVAAGACTAEKTALAVYGFAHTAKTWGPMAEAMFAEPSSSVCRVVALDLPGHGASGFTDPAVLPFPFLLLDDYATSVLGALDALAARGIAPRSLIAHSQGTMVVQMAQQRLVSQGSNVRKRYGIQEVTLLAPTMPAALPWEFVRNGTAAFLIGNFYKPELGIVAVDDALWSWVFFSRFNGGATVAEAPAPATVTGLGYNAPEPAYSASQLVGLAPFTRPAIDRGIFAGVLGTRLVVVAFEEDQLIRPAEADALFSWLTADRNGHKFSVVTGPSSVHDMFLSAPAEILAQVRPPLP